jgi:hypothetical protein
MLSTAISTARFLALSFLPLCAAGHHSSAEYDFGVVEDLEGQIAAVLWRNPHVRLTLRVPVAGSEQLWELEAQDVNSLGRRGLTADMIHAGDRVRVAGNPSRRREQTLYLTNVLLPSGTEIRMRGESTAPRWATRTAGFVAPARADASEQALAARGLFRVWLRPAGEPSQPVADLPLTPAARAALERWEPADDPALECVAPGMPGAMNGGQIHPIELVERGGDIVVRIESFDRERVIHMNADADSAREPATPLGYSVGRWEGDALVVRTTRISWPYFTPDGRIPQSENVVVDERFSLLEGTEQLVYTRTVTDSATFTAPVEVRWIYDWHPELTIAAYECTLGE